MFAMGSITGPNLKLFNEFVFFYISLILPEAKLCHIKEIIITKGILDTLETPLNRHKSGLLIFSS